jgi:hypothetical protein
VNGVDQSIRKSPQRRPPGVAEHERIERGMALHPRNDCVERSETPRRILAACLLPIHCLSEFGFGLGPENKAPCHPRRDHSRARTSFQVRAELGSCAYAAQRRAIPLGWSSDSAGRLSGCAATLSHKSSASWMRSAGLSFKSSAITERSPRRCLSLSDTDQAHEWSLALGAVHALPYSFGEACDIHPHIEVRHSF